MGFGVRRAYTNKSKKDGFVASVRFLCSKEGLRRADKRDHLTKNPRQETRTDYKVRMGLTNVNGIFRVFDLIEDQNHVLQTPKTAHMLPSQRKISEVQAHEIELAEDSGLQQRASSGVIMDFKGNEVVEDPKLARTMRYRQLCLKKIKLVTDAAYFEQAFLLVDKAADELVKQVAELWLKVTYVNNKKDDPIAPISECSSQPTWIKKRIGKKRKIRHMSSLDQPIKHLNFEVPERYGNQMNFDVPSRSKNTFSFTKFLMEPLITPLGGLEFYGGFSNENDDQASE
ncbi:protein FAR1-RELATED SEQUENCE 5-like [Senna tora]|uniref:Protein FAR1-RELATED SEQUENCE 5-like n=1 Tax=Senna tora TaxID=362788 RepID=A0A834U058_9FABA|nr:protein FAR1-RELATED SEQUENCE 5-like [Senna tora]